MISPWSSDPSVEKMSKCGSFSASESSSNCRARGDSRQLLISESLIDGLHLAIVPVLLGNGEHLLRGLNLPALGYECVRRIEGARPTHVTAEARMTIGACLFRHPERLAPLKMRESPACSCYCSMLWRWLFNVRISLRRLCLPGYVIR